MLTREQMRNKSQGVADIYNAIEDQMLVNMAKAFKKHRGELANDPNTWQILQLRELGALTQEQLVTIAQNSGLAIDEISHVLGEIGYEAMDSVELDVQEAAKQGISLVTAASTMGVVDTVVFQMVAQSKDTLNMVNTTMLRQSEDIYRNILQQTVAKHLTGTMTPHQALRHVLSEWSDIGIPALIDTAGRRWQPEAYINTVMRSMSGNVANGVQDTIMDTYDIDLVEISSHMGARPKCAPYQGRIYSRSGMSTKYPPLSETSYGEPAGIRGINCGHIFYPFIEGVSIQRNHPVDTETNDKAYLESQYQRKLENGIRKAKRKERVLQEAGDTEGAKEQSGKVAEKQLQMREFIDSTGRTRRRNREQIYTGALPPRPTPQPRTPTPPPPKPRPKPTPAEVLRKNVSKKEKEIRNMDVEQASVYNRSGKLLWEKKGATNNVDLSEAAAKGLLKGSIVTHNHPKSSSFSPEDIRLLMNYELHEIRAIGKNGNLVTASRTFDRKLSISQYTEMNQKIDSASNRIRREIRKEVIRGKLDPSDASIEHWHRVWSEVADDIGIKYERTVE